MSNSIYLCKALNFMATEPATELDRTAQRALQLYVRIGLLRQHALVKSNDELLRDAGSAQFLCQTVLRMLDEIGHYDFMVPVPPPVSHGLFYEPSGSMKGPEPAPETIIAVATDLLNEIAQPTFDRLEALVPPPPKFDFSLPGGTDVREALDQAAQQLFSQRGHKPVFLVITDGDPASYHRPEDFIGGPDQLLRIDGADFIGGADTFPFLPNTTSEDLPDGRRLVFGINDGDPHQQNFGVFKIPPAEKK